LKIQTNIVSCHTVDFKPVKQEVRSTVILPPLVFPAVVFVPVKPFQPSLKFAMGKEYYLRGKDQYS
jgi:hypothetical protein